MPFPATTYDSATPVNPTGALTDFSALIDLSRMSAAWWAAVNTTDGTRGRVFLDDGTELACDWIDFDPVAKTGWLRVKIPSWATSGSKVVRVYPPNTVNAAVAAGDTYGQHATHSAFKNYWPNMQDERKGLGDLTASGGAALVYSGNKVGTAMEMTTGQVAGNIDGGIGSEFTVSFWGKRDSATLTNNYWFESSSTDLLVNTSRPGFWTGGSDSGTSGPTSPHVFADTAWHHIAVSFGSGTRRLYIDGALHSSASGSAPSAPTNAFRCGALASEFIGGRMQEVFIGGRMQELQIQPVARSAAWIEQEYDQTNDQAAMWGTWANTPAPSAGRRRAMVIA